MSVARSGRFRSHRVVERPDFIEPELLQRGELSRIEFESLTTTQGGYGLFGIFQPVLGHREVQIVQRRGNQRGDPLEILPSLLQPSQLHQNHAARVDVFNAWLVDVDRFGDVFPAPSHVDRD